MAPDKQPSRVIFVGNIPYGLTEEQIIHIFSQAGQVLNFRLVYDRETGRPKGFGFAEYQDIDSAASAVRNLNDYEIMGRKLRVDFSNDGGEEDAVPTALGPTQSQPLNGAALPSMPIPPQSGVLPPLPAGIDLPPGVSCEDAISRTLSTLPASQLLDIITQMRSLVMADPGKATELLNQAPQLSYAIFQALLLMGLVDANALQSGIEQPAIQAAPPPQAQPAPPPTQSSFPPFPDYSPMQQQTSTPAPAVQGQMYSSSALPGPMTQPQPQPPLPPPAPAPAAAAAPAQAAGLDKATLFQYVLSLTPEQLNAMQPNERDQIMGVRQQILSGALRL